jgi:hypothetical protein
MQTQNTLVTVDLLHGTAQRALQLRPATFEKVSNAVVGLTANGAADSRPTQNSTNPARQASAHRSTFGGRADASVAWMAATLAILGVLTAMLMMGIAISV